MSSNYWLTTAPAVRDTTKEKFLVTAGEIKKLNHYFVLPTFSIVGVPWYGVSHEVAQFNYSATQPFSVIDISGFSSQFCPCIKWRHNNIVYRYKLWDDVNEILHAPLYNAEEIGANFCIEIWNVDGVVNINLLQDKLIITSILTIPNPINQTGQILECSSSPIIIADLFFNVPFNLPQTLNPSQYWLNN